MEKAFRAGRFGDGVEEGLAEINALSFATIRAKGARRGTSSRTGRFCSSRHGAARC
jgi:hypothetical protein